MPDVTTPPTDGPRSSVDSVWTCTCGLPMSRNPHPDAGKPTMEGVAVGYHMECIPCLVATRNRVGRERDEALAELEQVKKQLNKTKSVIGSLRSEKQGTTAAERRDEGHKLRTARKELAHKERIIRELQDRLSEQSDGPDHA